MQGEWTGELVGPDVWVTCRELIPAGSVFAFLAEHREAEGADNLCDLPESYLEPANSQYTAASDSTFTTAYDADGRPVPNISSMQVRLRVRTRAGCLWGSITLPRR